MYLVGGRQGSLGTLAFSAQLLKGSVVTADVHLVLALDQLDEVVHCTVIKVLSSQVGVSTGGQNLQSMGQYSQFQHCKWCEDAW